MPGHGPRSGGDPFPSPTSDGIAHQRRVYNVVDPSALARVWAAAIEKGHDAQSARLSVLAFVALMREQYDD